MIENGTPHITTEVWSAVKPPLYRSTAAIIPKSNAQVTRDIIGESSWMPTFFFDESIEATKAPESDEVTKKVTIMINARIETAFAMG